MRAARPPAGERVRRWNATAGPLVTQLLIGLNVAVFAVTAAGGNAMGRGGALQYRLALHGPAVAAGEWYRLVTAGFVHYGLLHVAFNMILLWQLGSMLEPALGRARFLALYLAALLAGSAGALLLSPDAFTGGASGAVFGLLGAAAAGLHRRGLSVWQSGIGGLIAVNLVLTFAVPGISVGGHVGGLAGGALVGAATLPARPGRPAVLGGVAFAAAVAIAAIAVSLWAAAR